MFLFAFGIDNIILLTFLCCKGFCFVYLCVLSIAQEIVAGFRRNLVWYRW